MADRITARVVGGEELARQLQRMKSDVNGASEQAITEAANAIRNDVRSNIRRDTGFLANSVDQEVDAARQSGWVGWSHPDAYYARFNEYGTKHRPADPALTNAAERERGQFPRRVRSIVRERLPR